MGNSLLERYPLLVRLPPSGPALDQPIAQTDSDVPSAVVTFSLSGISECAFVATYHNNLHDHWREEATTISLWITLLLP